MLLALGLFVIANAASALAESFIALMVWRAIAGIGAGVYLAMGIGASATASTPDRRGKAIAIIMGGMASGVVLGVPLSLLIAEQLGWQAAPLLADPAYGAVRSVTPYLWVWGIGGVLGSFLIGPLVDRIKGPVLTFAIMLILAVSLFVLPLTAALSTWLVMLPIALWGAVGWALQVPQNNELILARQAQGDGNLAIALNESALYLGSAIGAAAGGFVLLLQMPTWTLAASAGGVAALGALLQIVNLRRQPTWNGDVQTEPYN